MNFKAKIEQIFQDQITSINASENYSVILERAKAGKEIFEKLKSEQK